MSDYETLPAFPESDAETILVTTPNPVPDTFPMGIEEYAVTVRLDPLWAAGLVAYAGREERQRTEWDTLLAEFMDRPVRNS